MRPATLGLILSGLLVAGGTSAPAPSPTTVSGSSETSPAVERIAGGDRYATAAELALTWSAATTSTVFIVQGSEFPDALTSGQQAAKLDAPILLTDTNQLPGATIAAVEQLQPTRIVVVGGPKAVSESVLSELQALIPDGVVDRLAGDNRYATAVELTSTFQPGVERVYLASGETYSDALVGGALAGHEDMPLLLTRHGAVPEGVAAELARLRPEEVVVLGGALSVSDEALDQAATASEAAARRIAGRDRYETAERVAAVFGTVEGSAYVASGINYPDALVSGVAAARDGTAVTLVRPDKVPASAQRTLLGLDPQKVWVVGGQESVEETTLEAIKAVFGPTDPEPTSDRQVFAHYFPPYPLSIDNAPPATDYYTRHYLTPDGEDGKHLAYGGLLRDRPVEQAPLGATEWRVENLKTEVEQAKAAGIDGFTLNLMSAEGRNWQASVDLMDAASQVGGFTVIPNLDANGSISNLPTAEIAAKLAELYSYPASKQADGSYILSSFKAEGESVAWWRNVIQALNDNHGIDVQFIAVFLEASRDNMERFAPISHGFSYWGPRTPSGFTESTNRQEIAAELGKIWMAPVAFQDVRPYNYSYAEVYNTETLRASWETAIERESQFVQMVTWNDYSESTQFAPSQGNDNVPLKVSEYYINWYQDGVAPEITEDELFMTHRIHPVDAEPLLSHGLMVPRLSGTSTTPRDTVEVLTRLTAPATVRVSVGGVVDEFDAPAGISSITVPLRTGDLVVDLLRGGEAVISEHSGFSVVDRPQVQDLQYYGVYGRAE